MITITTLLSNHTSQDSNDDIYIHNWKKQLAFRIERRLLSTESLSLRRKQNEKISSQQTRQGTATVYRAVVVTPPAVKR